MNYPEAYLLAVLVVSAVVVVLFGIHLVISIREYQEYHDDRASRGLLIAMIFMVSTIGSLISAIGFFREMEGATFSAIGLGLVRGSFLVGGITLLLIDRRR